MTDDPNRRAASGLVSDALTHLSRIIRGEVSLAQAEMSASVRQAAYGIAMIAGAAILAITALNLLSAALVAAVVYAGLPPPWAALAVGVAFAVIAILLARAGMASLRLWGLVPQRTLRGLRRDVETIKEGLIP